ncbi:MAG: D-alanyl-D-alanine carboxypeptidase family protein [Armatimonadota bacterium]
MNKRSTVIMLILALYICCISAGASPKPPTIKAKSAIIIDALTGVIMYEKNSRAKREPASTTKIMTAILALEHGKLSDVVTASADVSKTQYSSMHLKPGENLTLNDLMYGLLLRSANDAAKCAAEYVAGSEENFAELMNEKAISIGALDTHFVNPHGLHNPNHYTTAYDLALITRYAIQNPDFNTFVRTKGTKINRSINKQDVTMRNTAKFLWKYKGADGIKTGHTKEAGRCFVGSVTRDNWRVLSVVLGSPEAGTDTIALMNYAFKFYKQVPFGKMGKIIKTVPVKYGLEKTVNLVPAQNLALVTSKTSNQKSTTKVRLGRVSAPLKKGEKVGTLTAFYGNQEVGTVDLLAAENVSRKLSSTIWLWTRNILLTGTILITGLITYGTAVAKAARRRRRRVSKAGRKSNLIR